MIVRKKYVKVVKFQLQVATLRCYFIHKSTVHFHKFMIHLSHSNFFFNHTINKMCLLEELHKAKYFCILDTIQFWI